MADLPIAWALSLLIEAMGVVGGTRGSAMRRHPFRPVQPTCRATDCLVVDVDDLKIVSGVIDAVGKKKLG